MVITQKIEVGISSNLLHSISTSICIRKRNKNFLVISDPFFGKIMGPSHASLYIHVHVCVVHVLKHY